MTVASIIGTSTSHGAVLPNLLVRCLALVDGCKTTTANSLTRPLPLDGRPSVANSLRPTLPRRGAKGRNDAGSCGLDAVFI